MAWECTEKKGCKQDGTVALHIVREAFARTNVDEQ